jgi:hypothetical protein
MNFAAIWDGLTESRRDEKMATTPMMVYSQGQSVESLDSTAWDFE